MPDKIRYRKGRTVPRGHGGIEDRIRIEYRRKRRSGAYHDSEYYYGGGTSALFMSLAREFKMPIVKIKNIVNFNGVSNRPLPIITPEVLHQRQVRKGEALTDIWRRRYEREFQWIMFVAERENNG